jgi:hypothetical protein
MLGITLRVTQAAARQGATYVRYWEQNNKDSWAGHVGTDFINVRQLRRQFGGTNCSNMDVKQISCFTNSTSGPIAQDRVTMIPYGII